MSDYWKTPDHTPTGDRPVTSTSTSTTRNEHLQAIHAECSGFVDGEPPDLEVIIQHAEALAAQADRWKRLALAYESHEDALLYGSAEDQENAREEARAARDALITSGDLLPVDGRQP